MITPTLILLVTKMLYASLAGGIIGLERELRGKNAGIKTFVLISCGAALFSYMSIILGTNDPARIVGQVATGVGFLGGGVIWKSDCGVSGMTTAAFIWVTAAIGSLVGIGLHKEALLLSLGMLLSISAIALFEKLLRKVVS